MHRFFHGMERAKQESYVRAKIIIGYDRDISCLYMVYAINVQQSIYSAKIVIHLQA